VADRGEYSVPRKWRKNRVVALYWYTRASVEFRRGMLHDITLIEATAKEMSRLCELTELQVPCGMTQVSQGP
jgi:hypothetical protein